MRFGTAIIITGGLALLGCSTPARLESDTPARVSRLNENFKVSVQYGQLPLTLDNDVDGLAFYAVEADGKPPEFIMFIHPERAQGAVSIPIPKGNPQIKTVHGYQSYVDSLLRAHRLLLKGELEDAKHLLMILNDNFGVTYGGLVMAANIALFEQDGAKAKKLFDHAKSLYPDGSQIVP